ncbi:MAG TPA: hypothetical protein PKD67_10500 [Ignavibacteriaceae bacterium]|nr:hypothetical protein [Ignavibacteriaceae bacterium]
MTIYQYKIISALNVLLRFRSSKELRKKFLHSEALTCRSGRLKKKCCLSPVLRDEFISFSVTAKKFSSSFGEHISFGSFLMLRKEHIIYL